MKYKKIILPIILLLNYQSALLSFQDRSLDSGSSSHHAAIGLAATLGAAGAYGYHRAYVRQTPEIINKAFNFIKRLRDEPLGFYTDLDTSDKLENLEPFLEAQKDIVKRALGVKESFTNIPTYFYDPSLEIRSIENLFETLKKTLNMGRAQIFKDKKLPNEIRKNSDDIYLRLLKIKNGLDPKTLPSVIEELLNDTTLESCVGNFLTKDEVAFHSTFSTLYGYIKNPNKFECDDEYSINEIKERKIEAQKEKEKFTYALHGTWMGQFFTRNIATKEEQSLTDDLFNKLLQSVQQQNYEDIFEKIKKSARACVKFFVKKLPIKTQWDLIEHCYIETAGDKIEASPPASSSWSLWNYSNPSQASTGLLEKSEAFNNRAPLAESRVDDNQDDDSSNEENEPQANQLTLEDPWADATNASGSTSNIKREPRLTDEERQAEIARQLKLLSQAGLD